MTKKISYVVVGMLWHKGLNTAEIADRLEAHEADVYRALQRYLAARKRTKNDPAYPAVPAKREPPVEGN